jgi:hypothetical protein
VLPPTDFHSQLAEAQRRSAAEAAEFLRRQNAAALSRTERAAVLNRLAHQMLRQQQAASLAELRQLCADWAAIGTGAGLDPILALELEATEAAGERAILAAALKLIADERLPDAAAKLDALDAPRHLPAAVVQALPDLRTELSRAVPFARMWEELQKPMASIGAVWQTVADVPQKEVPFALARAADAWRALEGARTAFRDGPATGAVPEAVSALERRLQGVAEAAGAELAKKIRVELVAQLFLEGRTGAAMQLLEADTDPVHTAAVLADLRAIVLGRGEITTPQVAAFAPAPGAAAPPPSGVILPADQLENWKAPARKVGATTVEAGIAQAKARLKAALDSEVSSGTTRISAEVERIRAALAAEAEPLKVFLEKLEVVRGKPFASPVERELATVAGARGLTVAETLGVLAAEADRPAVAARLLAAVHAVCDTNRFAVTVELAARAPAAFTEHADAGFRVTGIHTRVRVRDAVAAVVDAQAAKLTAGLKVEALDRAALEGATAKRFGVAKNALPPAEYVQGVLDVCRDWAADHARLARAAQELNEVVTNIEGGAYGPMDDELKQLLSTARLRRASVQIDRRRRETGVALGCQLLGAYGSAAKPAIPWLQAQLEGDRPWYTAAALNLARIAQEK